MLVPTTGADPWVHQDSAYRPQPAPVRFTPRAASGPRGGFESRRADRDATEALGCASTARLYMVSQTHGDQRVRELIARAGAQATPGRREQRVPGR